MLFLKLLQTTIQRMNWICHAYCLMGNHYHLLIEIPEGILSRGMAWLNSVYTQKFNRKYDTFGHLFQGRFKSEGALGSCPILLHSGGYRSKSKKMGHDPTVYRRSSSERSRKPAEGCVLIYLDRINRIDRIFRIADTFDLR
jgi:hypothetical protein